MAEVVVEIPSDLELLAKELEKKELSRIVCEALKHRSSEMLLFKIADEILKDSKMTDELALKLGDELKIRVAKRHGLM